MLFLDEISFYALLDIEGRRFKRVMIPIARLLMTYQLKILLGIPSITLVPTKLFREIALLKWCNLSPVMKLWCWGYPICYNQPDPQRSGREFISYGTPDELSDRLEEYGEPVLCHVGLANVTGLADVNLFRPSFRCAGADLRHLGRQAHFWVSTSFDDQA